MNRFSSSPALRHAPVLVWIVGTCAVLETVFTLLGLPPFNWSNLRNGAVMYGAFWPGLLADWQPLFPGQRMSMFVTHAFLHGGFMHMLFNMLILLHLGREGVERLGPRGFLLIYLCCAVAGAALYGLLSTSNGPMLGASGAVFGLFGTNMYWQYQRSSFFQERTSRPNVKSPLREMFDLALGLVVLNLVLYVLTGGLLAWQAHLGGFLAGFGLARLVTPTPRHRWRGSQIRH